MIPICQDTGMAVVFINVGQDVHLVGGDITEAINEGVRQGYTDGYLRKSVVNDPIIRENTRDNTPAVIHYWIVPGNKVKITVRFRGRELNYVKLGEDNLNKFSEALSDIASPEKKAVLEGKNMFIILAKKADK